MNDVSAWMFKTKLYNYQQYLIDLMSSNNNDFDIIQKHDPFNYDEKCNYTFQKSGYLTLKMGMGKTIIMLNYISKHNLYPALIVVPKSIIQQWMSEIKTHTNFKAIEFKNNNFESYNYSKYDIILITYTSLVPSNMINLKLKCIVVDEAHIFRNGSKLVRYNNLKTLIDHFKSSKVWLLSGTPIVNRYNDFVNVAKLIDMIDLNVFIKYNLINLNTFVYIKSYNTYTFNHYFEMDITHLDKYLGITHNVNNQLNNISGTSCVLGLINRLRQASIHPILALKNDIEINYRELVPHNIIYNLVDIVENKIPENDKVIIFVEWNRLADFISYFLNKKNVKSIIYKNYNTIQTFKTNLSIKCLIINILSGGIGLNLQFANHCIFTSHSWNYAIYNQAISRVDRNGQTKDVYIHNLYSYNSIQVWINHMINNKKNISDKFLSNPFQTICTEDIKDVLQNYINLVSFKENFNKFNFIVLNESKVLDFNDKCSICSGKFTDNNYHYNSLNLPIHKDCFFNVYMDNVKPLINFLENNFLEKSNF